MVIYKVTVVKREFNMFEEYQEERITRYFKDWNKARKYRRECMDEQIDARMHINYGLDDDKPDWEVQFNKIIVED